MGRPKRLGPLAPVLRALADERKRQDAIHGENLHLADGTGEPAQVAELRHLRALMVERERLGDVTWADILVEEVAEALAESDAKRLKAELIQVAAVCVKWAQAIDGRG